MFSLEIMCTRQIGGWYWDDMIQDGNNPIETPWWKQKNNDTVVISITNMLYIECRLLYYSACLYIIVLTSAFLNKLSHFLHPRGRKLMENFFSNYPTFYHTTLINKIHQFGLSEFYLILEEIDCP